MRGLKLLSQSHSSEVWSHRELAELSVEINEKWPSFRPPLQLEWTETPLASLDRTGVAWVIAPVERDPLRSPQGRTVLPRGQRARLKRIAELDVPFQRLAIAHELNPEGPVGQLLPALRDGPKACTDEVARALVGGVPENPAVTRAVEALDVLVCGAASVVPDGVWDTLLDPIIFGIIAPTPPRHGQLCLWYPLVAWRW
ncbi:MAG: hypothetical protein ACJ72M_20320 [Propionibacteriaceae bacterium]|jgi:hypothetical protein